MTKCVKFMAILSIIMLNGKVHGRPQELAEAGLLAFAQVKDTFDNGAAAGDKREVEIFGAKISNEMNVGFGDAARLKRSSADPQAINNFSRRKRSANTEDFTKQIIVNSKEKLITKRDVDDEPIVIDDSDEYDYSYSSYSSESEETERR